MHSFSYTEGQTADLAASAVASNPEAAFLAGGTTLIDLMKLDVITPSALVSVNDLPFTDLQLSDDRVTIGANVRNSTLAHHPHIRAHFPALSQALLAGASAQLRNMASTAGNIMQRTRCEYFRDVHSRCNKRTPGSGCDAVEGINRHHAVLGTSARCVATHPSDMCVALVMMETTVHTQKPGGGHRAIPFTEFHREPGDTPPIETVLERGELITHIEIKRTPAASNSRYLKARDRASYEFALASAAVGLELRDGVIQTARIGLGGVATKPWRSPQAEHILEGQPPTPELFAQAAKAALAGARPLSHNAFKIELAQRVLVCALEELIGGGTKA